MTLCLSLGTQHAMCIGHIVTCGLPGCAKFFHIISYMARLLKKSY